MKSTMIEDKLITAHEMVMDELRNRDQGKVFQAVASIEMRLCSHNNPSTDAPSSFQQTNEMSEETSMNHETAALEGDHSPTEISSWERHETEEGFEYWYNSVSGQSQWEKPALMKDITKSEVIGDHDADRTANDSTSQNLNDARATISDSENDYAQRARLQALKVIIMVHDAVRRDATEDVRGIVLAGIDINARDEDGLTPMFHARSQTMVKLLLELGATVNNVEEGSGQSVLHHFVKNGRLDPLRALIEALMDSQSRIPLEFGLLDNSMETPLHTGARCGLPAKACLSHLVGLKYVDNNQEADGYIADLRNKDGKRAEDLDEDGSLANVFEIFTKQKNARVIEECHQQLKIYEWELQKANRSRDEWEAKAVSAIAEQERLREENTQLREENTQLREENTQLREENTRLADSIAAYEYYQTGNQYYTGPGGSADQSGPDIYSTAYSEQEESFGNNTTNSYYSSYAQYQANPETGTIQQPVNDEDTWHQTNLDDTRQLLRPETDEKASPSTLHESGIGHTQYSEEPVTQKISAEKVGKVWAKFFERAAKASLSRNNGQEQNYVETFHQTAENMLADAIDDADPDSALDAMIQGANLEDLGNGSMLHRCCGQDVGASKTLQRKLVEIASLLMEYGADPEQADSQGTTPLHVACLAGNSLLVQFLLQSAVSPHSVDENGDSPLHCAAVGITKGHFKCVQLLAQYGANLTCQNTQGNTALDCARLQLVMIDEPPKALRQTVDLLDQLVTIAGDEPNPLQGEIQSANPYRVANIRDAYARVPQSVSGSDDQLRHETNELNLDTGSMDQDQIVEEDGWLTNIFGRVLPLIRQPPGSPANRSRHENDPGKESSSKLNLSRPPTDRQLAMMDVTTETTSAKEP